MVAIKNTNKTKSMVMIIKTETKTTTAATTHHHLPKKIDNFLFTRPALEASCPVYRLQIFLFQVVRAVSKSLAKVSSFVKSKPKKSQTNAYRKTQQECTETMTRVNPRSLFWRLARIRILSVSWILSLSLIENISSWSMLMAET